MRRGLFAGVLLLGSACTAAANQSNEIGNATATNAAQAESPPIGTDRGAAGTYRLTGQMEVASQLELGADGRFRYFLSYGALDQRAEGRWSSDGRRVSLNTEPRPRPAIFSARPPSRSSEAELVVFVATPDGQGINSVDVRVGLTDGRVLEGYTQDYGWRLSTFERGGTPQWVELSLAPYGVPPRRFAVDANAGNQFNFTFTPNDFGVVDFRDRMLDISGRDLLLREGGEALTYSREDRR